MEPKIESNKVSLQTIIRPVPDALNVIIDIVEYLKTTGGCQVLVIRADTGSGKTTFLNTIYHYIKEIQFLTQTIDLQTLEAEDFSSELQNLIIDKDKINLIILEGREKPQSISDQYIQIILANINRFGRRKRLPILFVVPTIEDQVARNWCEHGVKIGDLIPEQKLYGGSRWYNFPGISKDKYIEIAQETIRTLNPPYSISDYGINLDELKTWVENSHTIGKFIETIATRISDRRNQCKIRSQGKRDHVWIVYCCPDLQHYDHTYLIIKGLVQDNENLKASPTKLVSSEDALSKHWKQDQEWIKFVPALNFLDIRLINMPIITVVTAALVYGDDKLLESFRKTKFSAYKDVIMKKLPGECNSFDWNQPLAERRQKEENVRNSIAGTNLFYLLRGMSAKKRSGKTESPKILGQYLHLREKVHESTLHEFMAKALKVALEYHQFQGLIDIEFEKPLVQGTTAPKPDIKINTISDTYALEFHFTKQQYTTSEITRYALRDVIEKYMRDLEYLRSQLDNIKP
ncbi:hypothetical protein GM3708_118 [Geminocystis sp. NIES-3708]|uniref:hypothetical protein n=1 Tax=Geminocystis sp. NIES-3708 TaxID=1615909 RepID=UPI0005FC4EF7|nr:hypothetical protein [Geminocystis sp. NIES-3708]BAQ59713.1 hypothetical protein GM3708_118 [Geminocystis sp. NIES-3708]